MSAELTYEEIQKHRTDKDCWIVVDGVVYDVTKFLPDHPGGVDTIVDSSGGDATDPFEAVGHSKQARETMAKFKVGVVKVDPNAPKPAPRRSGSGSSGGAGVAPLLLSAALGIVAVLVGYYIMTATGAKK